jgi:hypothetical protein
LVELEGAHLPTTVLSSRFSVLSEKPRRRPMSSTGARVVKELGPFVSLPGRKSFGARWGRRDGLLHGQNSGGRAGVSVMSIGKASGIPKMGGAKTDRSGGRDRLWDGLDTANNGGR